MGVDRGPVLRAAAEKPSRYEPTNEFEITRGIFDAMISLVLAFHNHQPVGNFDWVFDSAYRDAYRPLMDALAEWPRIRFAQHYTGILLDWFGDHHPDFLEMIGEAVHERRVELISGGYFEPILPMLAERDRLDQIRRLNARIEARFHVRPTGMWLAERVWEPSLPSTLAKASIAYTFLDDTHFQHAGLSGDALEGYFLTEDQGRPLAVFPIDRTLRYTIPFEDPRATIEHLRSLDRPGAERVVVFADDGEKFGIWPGTHDSVYGQNWIGRFCQALDENSDWITTVHPGEIVRTRPPAGRIYLPTASYAEMLHWALPTTEAFDQYEVFERTLNERHLLEANERFVRGGFWRNFLVKYPEANAMQKKMMRVSDRLEAARIDAQQSNRQADPDVRGAIDRAATALLASQCNCPYWHGVFGGLYLSNIRLAVYRNMIEAERELDRLERIDGARVEVIDYDLDGFDEVIVDNPTVSITISPARGGAVLELDHKPCAFNMLDVFNRHPEGYHARLLAVAARSNRSKSVTEDGEPGLPDSGTADPAVSARSDSAEGDGARSIHDTFKVKEPGLERLLTYDSYRHGLFIDHVLATPPEVDALRGSRLDALGDFAGAPYAFEVQQGEAGGWRISLRREATVDDGSRMIVEKHISGDEHTGELQVDWSVRRADGRPMRGHFAVEMTCRLSAGNAEDRYFLFDGIRPDGEASRLASEGTRQAGGWSMVDEWLGLRFDVELSETALVVNAPIETVSLSEDGMERNYQGSMVLASWPIDGLERFEAGLRQSLTPLG